MFPPRRRSMSAHSSVGGLVLSRLPELALCSQADGQSDFLLSGVLIWVCSICASPQGGQRTSPGDPWFDHQGPVSVASYSLGWHLMLFPASQASFLRAQPFLAFIWFPTSEPLQLLFPPSDILSPPLLPILHSQILTIS